jgi:hypothetical protein
MDKDKNDILPKPKQDLIDQSLLKVFVSCGIPFAVVEHPFFMELFKRLCSSYILPSRCRAETWGYHHFVLLERKT